MCCVVSKVTSGTMVAMVGSALSFSCVTVVEVLCEIMNVSNLV